ncbi:GNAT family N-acetyltransferase [Pelagibius litoralis]|uniref:GNAT family N-acetyltransferase n=1 Tax=Pelagibius litoralis TaxID=374515 RepID=A0A967C5A3_9PROT|nr:GNAT family N-acetyltransferase [Pelagibius litoralis]NIA68994.1 GNAT family N-acetyltransferase [Pelagibius litoralis]
MPRPQIRLAEEADKAQIEAIVAAAYTPYLQRMDRPPGPMVDDYAKRIAAGQTHVLESNGRIVGILVLEPGEDFLLLDNIAVDPAAQGGGYGKILMAFAEAEARRQGYAAIVLYTNEVMVENIAIYARLGYVGIERKAVAGYDRVYMRKLL